MNAPNTMAPCEPSDVTPRLPWSKAPHYMGGGTVARVAGCVLQVRCLHTPDDWTWTMRPGDAVMGVPAVRWGTARTELEGQVIAENAVREFLQAELAKL